LITGLILAPVTDEFTFKAPFLSLAANAGLLVGAMFWGLGCDIWGRRYVLCCHYILAAQMTFGLVRWCFNVTLFLAGVFGLAAGGSPNFIALASFIAVVGVGVGGMLNHKS
jgi:MFS family permease